MSGHGIWGDPSLCSWSRGSTLPSLDLLRFLHVCLAHTYNQAQTPITHTPCPTCKPSHGVQVERYRWRP
ncbi:hypothetical protein LEMLEM_LOCUS10130, partial [Lemmus lemmus]